MSGYKINKVTTEEFADVMADAEVISTVDIGVALVSVCNHPAYGQFIGVSGCEELSALVYAV